MALAEKLEEYHGEIVHLYLRCGHKLECRLTGKPTTGLEPSIQVTTVMGKHAYFRIEGIDGFEEEEHKEERDGTGQRAEDGGSRSK